MWRGILAAAAVVGGLAVGGVRGEATISAAISLKGALDEAKPLLEKAAGTTVSLNYGASGTLANQIRQGAPVDLFLSADRATAQKLVDSGDADKGTLQVVATGQLVLVVPSENPAHVTGFADLARESVKRVAIGEPKVVPAGAYAKEALTALKLWDGLEKGGKLVTTENVAQALAFAARGEVDAAVVYATDALAEKRVKVVATAPAESHDAIEYLAVVPKDAPDAKVGATLEKALESEAVQAVMKAHGFGAAPAATMPAK